MKIKTLTEFMLEEFSEEKRAKLPRKEFALPDEKKFPINSEEQAKVALVWATWPQHKANKKKIVDAVLKKYPHLKDVGAAKDYK